MGRLAKRKLRIAVVGGGPGGLFAALLAKTRMPQHEVVVYERNAPDATFGFGVVFSERTLGGFADADPQLHAAMADASVAWEDIEVRRGGRALRCGGHGFSAISRRTLLLLMQRRAREAGVELRFEHEASDADLAGADLVLAADGVNSRLRARHEARFAPHVDHGRARFIWFATPQPFDALTFVFVEDEHGAWGLHAYPFEDGTSTFIVETDAETLRRAGLDEAGELPPGVSDMASLRYCEQLFAEHVGGHGLLENNSKWLRFPTLRCGRWHDGNVALLGDAAHTAHFSVGSGTKMAMEDAVALVDALGEQDEIGAALAAYEARRRPAVAHIQAAAAPSLVWWERFRLLADRSDEQFAFHFLTRSPAITRDRLRARDRRFVRRVERRYAEACGGDPARGALAAPYAIGDLRLPSRLVVAPPPRLDPLVALGGAAAGGAGLVLAAPGGADPAGAVAWVRASTQAAAGLRLAGADAPAAAAEAAVADGYDVLAVDAAADAARAWPRERVLLATVTAPADPEGADGDALLERLAALADGRPLLVGVAPRAQAAGDAPDPAQLLLCDRVREELGVGTVLVGGVRDADVAATELLAGRADLVLGTPSLVSALWEPGGALGAAATAVAAA